MDVFEFLNSPDVAAYLKKIGHCFTPLEAAFVVYHSKNTTLFQKQDAYREIIAEMPDCPVPKGDWCDAQPSLHRVLHDLMEYQSEVLNNITMPDRGIFSFTLFYRQVREFIEDDGLFSCFERCCNEAVEEAKQLSADMIRFTKRWPDDRISALYLDITPKGEILHLAGEGPGIEENGAVDVMAGLHVRLPLPFRRGDLITPVKRRYPPDSMTMWTCVFDGFGKGERARAYGYFAIGEGEVSYETVENPADHVFFRGEPEEDDRVLLEVIEQLRKESAEEKTEE